MSGLGDELRRIADELSAALERAEIANLGEGLRLVQEASSGHLTPANLAALDHPYATRHGSPQLDPDQVNIQTGRFLNSWVAEGPAAQGTALVSSIFNTDPKAAEFLEPGTGLMFARRPHEKAASQLEPLRTARIERAIEDVLGD